jgi:hypothetical protein
VELAGSIAAGYGYTYLDLGSASDVSRQLPFSADWDVRFARALEFDMGGVYSARSAVLLNQKQKVAVAVVAEQGIAEVRDVSGLAFDSDPLRIGASWYTFDHNAKTYAVSPTTYVLRTAEGHYGKLQIKSFYGPNQEQFWSLVKHGYLGSASQVFPE